MLFSLFLVLFRSAAGLFRNGGACELSMLEETNAAAYCNDGATKKRCLLPQVR